MATPRIPAKTQPKSKRTDHRYLIDDIGEAELNKKRRKGAQVKRRVFKIPPPPDTLDADGVVYWNYICEQMHLAGTYDDRYQWAMQVYADARVCYDHINKRLAEMQKDGKDLILQSNGGGMYHNPWHDLKKYYVKLAQELWVLLGCTVLDHVRIKQANKSIRGSKAPAEVSDSKKANPFNSL